MESGKHGRTATFGQVLHGLRRGAGLTQEELAGTSGISARAISDLERGRSTRPHARTVQALLRGLRADGQQAAALSRAARQGGRTPAAAYAGARGPGRAADRPEPAAGAAPGRAVAGERPPDAAGRGPGRAGHQDGGPRPALP